MSYIASNPESYADKKVANGQCVRFVQEAAGARNTSHWKQGIQVKGGMDLKKGTAIATFVDGKYANKPSGNHAAIYLSQDSNGLWVYDQWEKQGKVKKRIIRFHTGPWDVVNDGNAYYVIE
jgi:hypothetical protein